MIVAGVGLTRLTRRPSCFSTRHAWGPRESNSQAWPMTIGPEPITSTEWRSARFGIAAAFRLLHEVAELAEQPGRVVRARGGLGMELHAEHRSAGQPQAFDHAVVQVDVADLGWPERRFETPLRRHRDGEAVIVAGDQHPAGPQVLHRMVDAAVPEPELVGAQAEGPAENLAAQADTEQRNAGGEHRPHRLDRITRRRGIAGPVGEEDPVRGAGQDLGSRARRRKYPDLAAEPCHGRRRHGLDARSEE